MNGLIIIHIYPYRCIVCLGSRGSSEDCSTCCSRGWCGPSRLRKAGYLRDAVFWRRTPWSCSSSSGTDLCKPHGSVGWRFRIGWSWCKTYWWLTRPGCRIYCLESASWHLLPILRRMATRTRWKRHNRRRSIALERSPSWKWLVP